MWEVCEENCQWKRIPKYSAEYKEIGKTTESNSTGLHLPVKEK